MANVVNSISGSAIVMSIATNLTTPVYKEVVCSINNGLAGTRPVNSKPSRCGTAKAGGEPDYKITGNLVANTAPSSSEMSADDLIALFDSGDDFLFKLAHVTTPADYFRQGQGFFADYNETVNNNDTIEADYTIEVKGSIDFTS